MSILKKLSTQSGDRTSGSNLAVAALCIEQPKLLEEIVSGLESDDDALGADCAEVCTEVAKKKPEAVAPYAKHFPSLLDRKTTRLRWEAMHTLALVANLVPGIISPMLPKLAVLIRSDKSVIVRDYAVDAVSNFAGAGAEASKAAYPILVEALDLWNCKHAGHALAGLVNVAGNNPKVKDQLRKIADRFSETGRGVVQKAAKALIRTLEKK
jgi:hypothetical protein